MQHEPFEPFIIRASSGHAVRVARPELAVLMKSAVFVAAPNSDEWAHIPYLHIAGLESDRNGDGNGKRRRGRG